MTDAIVATPPNAITPYDLTQAGQTANEYAARNALRDYSQQMSLNTQTGHRVDLETFSDYLYIITDEKHLITGEQLMTEPEAWLNMTWGLIAGFKQWMLKEGYAIATINHKLSTVRTYANLAAQAGTITGNEVHLISTVRGLSRTAGRHLDEQRAKTRKGTKKAHSINLNPDQVKALLDQPDTRQGRRDKLLICLMALQGLRVGEVAALSVFSFNVRANTFTFYRQKVGKWQTHVMNQETANALIEWYAHDSHEQGPLLRSLRRGTHSMNKTPMTEQGISGRVRELGHLIGIQGLSAHDLRHYWATDAARNGTPIDRLKDAGGWSSHSMPMRYIADAEVSNKGLLQTI